MPLEVAIDEPLETLNLWSRVQGDVVLQRLDGSLDQLSMSLFVGDICIAAERHWMQGEHTHSAYQCSGSQLD